ncbi:MAG TPA: ribosomal-protein-alanine N-acetyltransferase [Chromatiales bacterium]|nr:ribosomal-protein-alanine N-acetyltransferase [Chromatiales bacterium]
MNAVARDLPARIRPMRQEDVTAVAALERAVYQFPWSAGIFRDCLLAGYTSVTLEHAGEVLGYSIMSIAAGEAHLLNVVVAPVLRRQGFGRELLEYMLERAAAAGAERVILESRPSNRAAMQLYRDTGFEVIGVRRGYYRAVGGREDAVVLARRLTAKS